MNIGLRSSLARLREITPKLNQVTDDAVQAVRQIEQLLAKDMQIGIQATVHVGSKPLQRHHVNVEATQETSLAFRRMNGVFRIVVEISERQATLNELISWKVVDETPWLECPRAVKLETYPKLPDLLEELGKEVERIIVLANSAHPEVQKVMIEVAKAAHPDVQTSKVKELKHAHEEYERTVHNNYVDTMQGVATAFSRENTDELEKAVADWLKDFNREYYRYRPEEAATLIERLKPILRQEFKTLVSFRERSIKNLTESDKTEILRVFGLFEAQCGPIGASKALHVLAPNFFPLWDNDIAKDYGVKTKTGYFQFMEIVKQQVLALPEEIAPGVTSLKALDEYNYLSAHETRAASRPRAPAAQASAARKATSGVQETQHEPRTEQAPGRHRRILALLRSKKGLNVTQAEILEMLIRDEPGEDPRKLVPYAKDVKSDMKTRLGVNVVKTENGYKLLEE